MKKIIFLLLPAIMLLSGCDKDVCITEISYESHYLMTVTNKSDAPIVCFVPAKGSAATVEGVTELPATISERERSSIVTIPAKSAARINIIEDEEPDILEEYGVADCVTFYVFDETLFNDTSWEEIVSGKLWLARYSYTAKQLIDAGKSIVYPTAQ